MVRPKAGCPRRVDFAHCLAAIVVLAVLVSGGGAVDAFKPKRATSGYNPADANCTITFAHSASLFNIEAASHDFSMNIINGETLWLEWVNQEYGPILVDGNKLCNFSLRYVDDSRNATLAAAIYRGFLNDSSVDFLLGPTLTGPSMGAVAVTEPAGRLLLGTAVASNAFYKNRPYAFITQTPHSTFVDSALKIYSIKGAKTVVWIAENPTTPDSAFVVQCSSIQGKMADLGMTLLGSSYVPDIFGYPTEAGQQNISLTVDWISSLDPDVLISCGNAQVLNSVLEMMKTKNYLPRAVYGTFGDLYSEEVRPYLTAGAQWTELAAYPPDPYFGTPMDWFEKFEKRFNYTPPVIYFAAAGTTAPLLLQLAIERARTLNQDAVRTALATTNLDLFWGRVSFDAEGAPSLRDIVVLQFNRTAEPAVVGPFRSATAEVVYPIPNWDDRTYDPEYFDHSSEIALAVLSGVFILTSLALMIFVGIFWRNVVITAASPLFLLLFLSGSIILYASIFMWMLHTNDAMCILTFWFLAVGFGLMFGALFAKTWRIKKILYPEQEGSVLSKIWVFIRSIFCLNGDSAKKANRVAKKKFKNVKVITWKRLLVVLAVIVGIEVIICSIFTIIAPFFDLAEKVTKSVEYQGENYTECEETAVSITFIVILVVYNFCLLLYGVFLSWVLRNVQWALFNESKSIAFAMYNLFFFGALIGGLQVSDSVERETMFIVRSALILCAVAVAVAVIFLPKIYFILRGVKSIDGSTSKTDTMSIEMAEREEGAPPISQLDVLMGESAEDWSSTDKVKARLALQTMKEIITSAGLGAQLTGVNKKLVMADSADRLDDGSVTASSSASSSESDIEDEEGIP